MKKPSQSSPRKRPSAGRVKTLPGENLRVVYPEKQIEKRVRELADRINRDYQGKTTHLVANLENSFMFMADLLRLLKIPVVCHFIKAEIRDRMQGATALREIMYTPRVEAAGKDVLLVDGILQSGVTQDHLYRYILGQVPASVRTVTLIEKSDERKVDVPTDYVGFKSTEKFLVGYGLGYQDKYRNLPFVATVS